MLLLLPAEAQQAEGLPGALVPPAGLAPGGGGGVTGSCSFLSQGLTLLMKECGRYEIHSDHKCFDYLIVEESE